MRFIDWGDERYVSVSDLVAALVNFAPVVGDKVGVDWPIRNIISYVLESDLRDPDRVT